MRKGLREITDMEEILDIIRNTQTIRLGIFGEKYPYVVPVSFGYDYSDGRLCFYFHGAKEGQKFDLLEKNPYVCVEGDIFYRFKKTAASVTCLYESFIAYGKAALLSEDEAYSGLEKILGHCGYPEATVNEKCAEKTAVFRITVEQISGKRRDARN